MLTWSRVLQQSNNTPTGWVILQALLQLQLQIRGTETILPERRREEKVHYGRWRVSTGNTASPRFPDPGSLTGRLGRQGLNAGYAGGDGQDVELVIDDKTLYTRPEKE